MTATAEELQRELETLDARLADGERRIAEALNMEVDTTDWERFWWDMLRRYQETYRRLHHPDKDPETFWDDFVKECEQTPAGIEAWNRLMD